MVSPFRGNCAAPVTAYDIKRISRHAVHPVVGTIHHKLHIFGDSAKLADNQPVTDEVVEMSDVLLELVCTIHVIIIGIVANDDTRALHHVLDEAEAWDVGIRESLVGVGPVFYFHNSQFCRLFETLCQIAFYRMKLVYFVTSFSGSPLRSRSAAMARMRKAMLRPKMRMICTPSSSCITSSGVWPCTMFQ